MRKYSGFTIAEVVITTVIVGIVSLVGLMSFKPNAKMKSAYYKHIYDTLKTAAYNGYLEKHDRFGHMPGSNNFTPEGLCEDLVFFINTTENNCDRGGPIDFNDENRINFITTNGISFWFYDEAFPIIDGLANHVIDSYGNDISRTVVIVYADISPKQRNKVPFSNARDNGNIVPFLITDLGEVLPIGAPLLNSEIIKAGVKLTYNQKDHQGFISSKYVIIPADNYLDAKEKAWGDRTIWANNPMSFDPFCIVVLANYTHPRGFNNNSMCSGNSRSAGFNNQPACLPPRFGGEPARGTGTCQTVATEVDEHGNPVRQEEICCQTCEYNCSPVILNKKINLRK